VLALVIASAAALGLLANPKEDARPFPVPAGMIPRLIFLKTAGVEGGQGHRVMRPPTRRRNGNKKNTKMAIWVYLQDSQGEL